MGNTLIDDDFAYLRLINRSATKSITTRSSSASAGTLKVTGARSASTVGALTARAVEQHVDCTAPGGGENSSPVQYFGGVSEV